MPVETLLNGSLLQYGALGLFLIYMIYIHERYHRQMIETQRSVITLQKAALSTIDANTNALNQIRNLIARQNRTSQQRRRTQ